MYSLAFRPISFVDRLATFAGVITYSTNLNTSAVIRNMVSAPTSAPSTPSSTSPLRILLETDAPYMVPGNIYRSLTELKGGRLPLCHTAMVPWTADFVAGVASAASGGEGEGESAYDGERIMREARENARRVYGV